MYDCTIGCDFLKLPDLIFHKFRHLLIFTNLNDLQSTSDFRYKEVNTLVIVDIRGAVPEKYKPHCLRLLNEFK